MTSGSAQRKPLPGGHHLLLSYYLAVRLRVSPRDFHPHLSIFFWQGRATFRCCKGFRLGSFSDKSVLDFSHPLHNMSCKICGRKGRARSRLFLNINDFSVRIYRKLSLFPVIKFFFILKESDILASSIFIGYRQHVNHLHKGHC